MVSKNENIGIIARFKQITQNSRFTKSSDRSEVLRGFIRTTVTIMILGLISFVIRIIFEAILGYTSNP